VSLHFNPFSSFSGFSPSPSWPRSEAFGSTFGHRPSARIHLRVVRAQVVTFLAWAITALSIYLVVNEGTFAVMLLYSTDRKIFENPA